MHPFSDSKKHKRMVAAATGLPPYWRWGRTSTPNICAASKAAGSPPPPRWQIDRLNNAGDHFVRLFDEHNALDQHIENMVSRTEPGTPEQIEQLKKEKLALKDQIYVMLKKAAQDEA